MNKIPVKKNWREFNIERKKRRAEKIIKKLDKAEAQKTEQLVKAQANIPIAAAIIEEPKSLQTCSIAVPGSILDNAQTQELRTYLAGQIARAACIYRINEVIIFDDTTEQSNTSEEKVASRSCIQFARLLQYLECPQYLRKHFFPIHKDLQFIGLLNPLDAPHHLRQTEECDYREGITTDKPTKTGSGCYVNVGLSKDIKIDEKLTPGLRVTVKLNQKDGSKKLYGQVVSPEEPMRVKNLYWGYSVRIAHTLTEVITKSPYPKGYDVTIGTSDKGKSIDELKKKELKDFRHVLIIFGGLKGLESALENSDVTVEHPSLLFDYYLNTCPRQGSRTIRTEEAILITLAELRHFLSH